MSLFVGLWFKRVLDGSDAVKRLAPGGIHPVVAPAAEDVQGAHVWFCASACTDMQTKDGWCGDDAEVAAECVAPTYEALIELTAAVRAAVYDAPGAVEDIPCNVDSVQFSAEEELYDMQNEVYSRMLKFSFQTSE